MKRLPALLLAMVLVACGTRPQQPAAHPDWSYNSVVYEMNVRQYTPEGTLAAAARHLPRLRELGVDVVWLMPVYPIGVKERKGTLGSYYAISDYEAVNPEFGTLEDFDRFLAEAHRLGLRVILDWVANHTSPDARWIEERPADWYVRDSLGNTIVQYDWTDIAKLDYGNADMRAAMAAAMRFWLDRGIDGFRCDMACEVPIDFWQQTLPALRKEYPGIYLLAEGEAPALHDGAFDASYAWELHHLLNDIAQGRKSAADLRAYWVANHTSPDARWIEERPADWYVRDSLGNTIVQYDWTDIAKLDYGNADMRAAMAAAMRFWLDRGIDGFRCDMACEVPIDFWQQTLPALRKEYPGIYLLAEGEAPALHDGAFDASYAWELHHLLNDIAQGRKSAADLRAYVARDAAAMPREAFRLMFTSNHDENSWAGTEFERMGDAARVMALLTFTLPNGQPLVYTGQEMGFDHRFEFFEKDPVPAWERNGFTDFYAALIRLRHENPVLAAGERGGQAAYPLGERTPDGLMLFSRTAGGNEVTVAANLSAEEVAFDLPFEGSRREFFTGKEYTGGTRTVLPAWQWLVFAQDRR